MDSSCGQQLIEWNESLNSKAKNLVKIVFPQRVLELNKLLNSENFDENRINEIHSDVNLPPKCNYLNRSLINHDLSTKKRKFLHKEDDTENESSAKMDGMLTKNPKLRDLINIVKPLIKRFVEDINRVKLWIILLIPRIEDGNNFGVSVQEDILEEIRTVEGEAAVYYDDVSKYHHSRAKVISKIAKYPFIEDYRETLIEVDEKEWFHLKLVIRELRNHYNTLHSLMTKNWEKLTCPRQSNSNSMF